MRTEPFLAGVAALVTVLAALSTAGAANSKQGPITISIGAGTGTLFVGGNNPLPQNGADTGARFPSIDLLYHLEGASSGLNFGVREDVWFRRGGTVGLTAARGGYDIPMFVAHNRYEITIAPYGLLGIGYGAVSAEFVLGIGADGRFYFKDNFFGYVRPVELEIHAGSSAVGSYTSFDTALGAGVSF